MKRTVLSDMPAIGDLRTGNAPAWERFFSIHESAIRSVVAWPRWHFDAHTREDAVQVIKLAIVGSIERLHEEAALPAFVRRIAVNRCIDLLRKQLRIQNRLAPIGHWNAAGDWEDVDFPADAEFDPVAILQRSERAAILRAAVSRLDETDRDCIRQFYVEGLSYREMAERQGVAVNTIGSRLSRCLERLRDLLGPTDVAPGQTDEKSRS